MVIVCSAVTRGHALCTAHEISGPRNSQEDFTVNPKQNEQRQDKKCNGRRVKHNFEHWDQIVVENEGHYAHLAVLQRSEFRVEWGLRNGVGDDVVDSKRRGTNPGYDPQKQEDYPKPFVVVLEFHE